MEPWLDLYRILQVHPDAEMEIIQSAYKRLCKKYHPDINPSALAAERMKQINGAYEILSSTSERARYHAEWLRRTPQTASPRVEVRERVVYVSKEPAAPKHGGTEAACRVVCDYFGHLSEHRFREAFALISEIDRRRITYGSFVEWQESVSALYQIGSFEAKLFKRHPNLKLDDDVRVPAEEYAVSVSEKIKKTGEVRLYSLSKYAIWENGLWRVYLGYRDLAPIMMQFKSMATTPEEVQMLCLWEKYRDSNDVFLGLPNRKGFAEKIARFEYLFKRHQRVFSLGVFQISPPGAESEHVAHIVKYVGYILSNGVRCIDTAATLGENLFGIIFAETGKKAASLAARRLLRTIRHDVSACFDFAIDIRAGVVEYAGQDSDALIEGCLRVIGAAGECPPPYSTGHSTG